VIFQKLQHLSVTLPEKLTVIVVPVFTVPLARNAHNETVVPSAATPPGELVVSLTFHHVPVPPDGIVWLADGPSDVAMLSLTTVSRPKSPAARVLVAVLNVKVALLVLFAPVPSVPPEAIAIYVASAKRGVALATANTLVSAALAGVLACWGRGVATTSLKALSCVS
jgi:hypothetical protein